MENTKLFNAVEELYEEYIKVFEDVCNIESPTDYKMGVDAVGDYFAEKAKALGFSVEYLRHEKAGNALCITMNKEAKGETISLSGHMDTVHAVGSFGYPVAKIKNGNIYAPGACDCKGGIVAGLLAMHALHNCGYKERPVQLLLQSDEENGSKPSDKATINYICEKAKDSVAFLNLEGNAPRANEACLVRKGIVTFTFTVTGKEAHSSKCATQGANAIADAAYRIIELEKIKDEDGLTCNCGVISGGTVPNTVPGRCEFKANVRFANAQQLKWIREYVQKIADTEYVKGCSCTVDQPKGRVAMELCDRNVNLLNKINGILKNNGIPELTLTKRTGGSDAADVAAYGIPCIDSIGIGGGYIHSPREYAVLEELKTSANRIAVIIKDFNAFFFQRM